MPATRIFITGFGPFEEFASNPSGDLAVRFARTPPRGTRVDGVRLPVSFERAVREVDRRLDALHAAGSAPALLVGLGLHRGEDFRIELRARARLTRPDRPDVDGCAAADVPQEIGEDLRSPLEDALRSFAAARPGWIVSEDAGGYVCERTYRRLLEQGRTHGVPALFLHVPSEAHVPVDAQEAEVGAFLAQLAGGEPPGSARARS